VILQGTRSNVTGHELPVCAEWDVTNQVDRDHTDVQRWTLQTAPKSEQFWAISSASVSARLCDFRLLCTVLNCVIQRRPGGLFYPPEKRKQNLLSTCVVVHSCYMPEGETPALDDWGRLKWLTGPPVNFCIRNKLVPLDTEQAPLIEGINFPCILLGDPRFRAQAYRRIGKMYCIL